jgi:hypothetical protein
MGGSVTATDTAADARGEWSRLFADEDWYKQTGVEEQVFQGKLESVQEPVSDAVQRSMLYRVGERTIYTGGRKVAALDTLVGSEIEIRGKAVDMAVEGQAFREVWPAFVRGVDGPKPAPRTHQSILTMKHTGGWGTGVQAEFTLDADGGFRWRTKEGERSGVIPAAATRQLREEVSSAGAGPAAEDAGYVEFTWLDDGGKDGSQAYSHPGEAPCRRLLDRIEGLVKKHGAARADQGGAVRDGRAEPRDPAASR